MNTSEHGIELLKRSEAFIGHPYLCPAGKATIGYGCTHYPDSTPVRMTDAHITEAQGEEMLKAVLTEYEEGVDRVVKVPLTQGQFDALVDFAYNVGLANLRTSTLLKKLNDGNYGAAAAQFDKWVYAAGTVLPGLVKRRAHEKALFMGTAA